MSNQSNDFLKAKGFRPKVSLSDKATHRVEFVEGKMDTIDFGKGPKSMMRYLVVEGGEIKDWLTESIKIVQALSEAERGDVFDVSMFSKSVNGNMISDFNITFVEKKNPPTPVEDLPAEVADAPQDEISIEDLNFSENK